MNNTKHMENQWPVTSLIYKCWPHSAKLGVCFLQNHPRGILQLPSNHF
uniref:Uncharacterized protein n=1 Tax=Anguilla anguilla TaxID=7936 RepID=A0A0E9TA04_ANGAN